MFFHFFIHNFFVSWTFCDSDKSRRLKGVTLKYGHFFFLQLCCFPECHGVCPVIAADRVQWRWCNRRKENRKGVVQHCLSARWRHSRAGVTLLFWSGKIWGSVSSCFSAPFIAPTPVVGLCTLHRRQRPDKLTLPVSTINSCHAHRTRHVWLVSVTKRVILCLAC